MAENAYELAPNTPAKEITPELLEKVRELSKELIEADVCFAFMLREGAGVRSMGQSDIPFLKNVIVACEQMMQRINLMSVTGAN